MAPIAETEVRLKYNGVHFTLYSSDISGQPIYDSAERTVISMKWLIKVRAYVFAGPEVGADTDLDLLDLRRRLTKPGMELTCQGKGFGSLNVNAAGGARDVRWGPKPHLFDWQPLGDDRAALVTWQVETVVPECENALFQRGIMSLTFGISQHYDDDNYLTRTTTIKVEIPMTRPRGGGRTLQDHVDRIKPLIWPTPMVGFKRTHTWNISEDKRVGTLTISDTQLPTTLPQGTTRCDLRHGYRNEVALSSIMWRGNLSGPITMAAGQPKRNGWLVFLSILQDRLLRIRNPNLPLAGGNQPVGLGQMANNVANNNTGLRRKAWITNISVSDEVCGRSTSYSCDWWAFTAGGVQDLIAQSGMWTPVPGSNFGQWAASLNKSMFHPRGSLGVVERPQDDLIIDLCTREDIRIGVPTVLNNQSLQPAGKVSGVNARRSTVPPEESWVDYQIRTVYSEDGRRHAVHQPMTAQAPRKKDLSDIDDPARQSSRRIGLDIADSQPAVGNIVHETSAPLPRIRLTGRALRLGHPIPMPHIVEIAGQPAYRDRVNLWTCDPVKRGLDGEFLWAAAWDIEFITATPPDQMPTATNPFLGVDGN